MIEQPSDKQQAYSINYLQAPIQMSLENISPIDSDREIPLKIEDALIFGSQSKLNQDEIEKMNKNIVRQFNKQTTLEEIENPFLSMDDKIKNALMALKKPIYQRNLKEQKAIIRVIESNQFIQKTKLYNKSLLNQISNCVQLEKIQKGKPVFWYGDRPDKFYLIVKGKVSVLVPKSKNEIAQIKEELQNNSFSSNSIESPLKKMTHEQNQYSLLLNFPNISTNKNNIKKLDKSNDFEKSQHSLDSSKNYDEYNSPLTAMQSRKKSNFSQINSERQIKINQNIKKITTVSPFQPALQIKKNILLKKKRLDDYQYQDHDVIIPGIPLTRQEIFNWKQYFLVEDEVTIMKYNHIKFLTDGEVFGDFGLLIRKPRSATILAVQDTIVLSIQKSDYEELIREISYNKMEKKVKFFQQSLCFNENKIKPEQLNQIVLDFSTKIKLNQGWNLFQEGDPTDSLYLIKKGELQLSKHIRFTYNETTQQYSYDIESNHNNLNDSLTNPSTSKKGKLKTCQLDYIIVSAKEFIGSEDLFYNKKFRTYTAKCLTDVTVYVIQKSQLLKLINEFFFFKIAMQKYAHSKLEHHLERIDSVASAKKLNLELNQKNINTFRSSSQKDFGAPNNSERKSFFCRNTTQNFMQQFLPQQNFQSKTLVLSLKNSSSNIQGANKSEQSFKNFQDNQQQNPNMYYNHIPSLQLIDEGSQQQNGSIQQNGYLSSQKRLQHKQPIMSEQNNNQNNEDLKLMFEDIDIFRNVQTYSDEHIEDEGQPTSPSGQNQFWFDQGLKTQLDKKINHQIKEKDPSYIKKVRQTFKGNMECSRYGLLEKRLNKLISSKPKLISTVFNQLQQTKTVSNEQSTQIPLNNVQKHKSSMNLLQVKKQESISPEKISATSIQFQSQRQIELGQPKQLDKFLDMQSSISKIKSQMTTPRQQKLKNFYMLVDQNDLESNDYQIDIDLHKKKKCEKSKSIFLSTEHNSQNSIDHFQLQPIYQCQKLGKPLQNKTIQKQQSHSFTVPLQSPSQEQAISKKKFDKLNLEITNSNSKSNFASPRLSIDLMQKSREEQKMFTHNIGFRSHRSQKEFQSVKKKNDFFQSDYFEIKGFSKKKEEFLVS
ncbi:cyclic nucleotide-binding domain protein (macronuclear) [Tetrahymena thermophila SB210]|uniref:Cyclic nucleotide-binding domain protein n=1 Tax=Tetrahymena thermophila (strain SB210) TaxID=312017 RepID=I7M3X4_TETTS|nr:cyclic nucleotide-binding domain protein [Tetrahymena thermophila SB210]EAS04474.2 cyclic nucleotide-binding domain protein [Tetrahymena thermophila SB210]|eukprot:XP_001024719.2 cyclic nucleotide-binding domain protein [Tetrahymena thermophila SB210]